MFSAQMNPARTEAQGRQLGETLAIAALVIYVAAYIVFSRSTLVTTFPALKPLDLGNALTSISMALAITAIAVKSSCFERWQILLIAVTLTLLLISSTRTGTYLLAQGFVLLIAVSGIKLDRLCKAYFLTVMPILIMTMMLSVTGLEYNRDIIPNDRLVFSYGLAHPNAIGGLLFSTLGALTFVCWKKRTWFLPLVLSPIAAAFSYVSLSSHASTILLAALGIVICVGHIRALAPITNISRKIYIVILIAVPLCLSVLMLICTACYDASNPIFSWFNKLIHGRPYYAHEYYLAHDGFTLFGKKYVGVSEYHNGLPFTSVDSGYCRFGIMFGILPMIALFATYLAAVVKTSDHEQRFVIFCILLLVSLYLLIEQVPLYIALNFAALFLAPAFECRQTRNRDAIEREVLT